MTTAGVLTFLAAPDYENPTDTGADNGYEVTGRVSTGVDGCRRETTNTRSAPLGPTQTS